MVDFLRTIQERSPSASMRSTYSYVENLSGPIRIRREDDDVDALCREASRGCEPFIRENCLGTYGIDVRIAEEAVPADSAGRKTSPAASAGRGEGEASRSATKVVGRPRFRRPPAPAHRWRTCNDDGNERSGDPGHENDADNSEAGGDSEPTPLPRREEEEGGRAGEEGAQ